MLEWFAQDPHVPLFWEGLKLVLQPHQCAQLRAWLPRLGHAAVLAQSLTRTLSRHISEEAATPHYMSDFTAGLPARVVLDGEASAATVTWQLAEHWAAKEKGLQDALRSQEVIALLDIAHSTR